MHDLQRLAIMLTVALMRAPRHSAFNLYLVGTTELISRRANTRLFSSTTKKQSKLLLDQEVPVEISPADHGTSPIKSLIHNNNKNNTLDRTLVQSLKSQGFVKPTPIQSHAIPLLLAGYDVMASAQTGTGKTLMFGVPLCHELLRHTNHHHNHKTNINRQRPAALILNPTRELAIQTAQALQALAAATSSTKHNNNNNKNNKKPLLRVALATGGADVGRQKRQLQNCDILVGTPGRVLQFVDERSLSLQNVRHIVVDEADRMLDLGFEPQLQRIARALSVQQQRKQEQFQQQERQTVLCSATFPPEVQRVAADFLKQDYYFVAAGRVGATHQGIEQKLLWIDDNGAGGGGEIRRRRRSLVLEQVHSFLNAASRQKKQSASQGVIVFCNTKDEAERIGGALKGYSVRVVTGDKTQAERNKSLDAFRRGKVRVLVASDVASRGLDVSTVGLVVQADAPRDIDTFVHRVGRTGRAGAKGQATALLDARSVGIAPGLVQLMEEANQVVPPWLRGMSHVATARRLEEEGAIDAGGGSSLDETQISEEATTSVDGKFSNQDFRSKAEAGTWGSERDKSFRSFDDEAYRSLDDFSSPELSRDKNVTFDDKSDEVLSRKPMNSSIESSKSDCMDSVRDDARRMSSFKRLKSSKDLLEVVHQITNSSEIGSRPNRKILNALSRKGISQRLRFEYLGMFPFQAVAAMLTSKSSQRPSGDGRHSTEMPRVLMVAEKPSIAKAIADALSGSRGPRQRRGISRALPVYEFTSNAFLPGNATNKPSLVTVTSVVGHVFSLGFVQEEKKTNGERAHIDPADFFHLPVVKQEEGTTGKLRVVDHLRALAADCDHLVLWLDCDAEGENIAHEVIGVTRRALEQKMAEEQRANPDALPKRRVHRARFSAITGDALRGAFSNLVEPDADLSRAVDARQELDLRVGVAITRLLTWRCVSAARRHFSPTTKLVSYGPCQTPALSFCVDRANEIAAFQSQDYWRVHVSVSSPGRTDGFRKLTWKAPESTIVVNNRNRSARKRDSKNMAIEESATFDQALAQSIIQVTAEPSSSAFIRHVEEISEQIKPPFGLNTVALLAAGSKAMGMSPKQVMNVAEKLYSAGFISYPRTETTRYDPTGFDVRSVLREHASHPEWGRTASHLLRTKYKNSGRPPNRGHDAGDHPPITCLKAATREEVGHGAAWRVYEFIARNFIGSLAEDLQFTRRVANIGLCTVENGNIVSYKDGDRFELEQVSVDKVGFAGACRWVLRDIGAESPQGRAENEREVPYEKGMLLSIKDSRVETCATKPPCFLQEHELIELMDQNRIGTDASMATHVNNIVDRGYVVLCDESGVPLRPPRPPRPGQPRPPRQIGRYLVPTPLGMNLMSLFGDMNTDDDTSGNVSPLQLSRPAIRAQMEAEVAQIAHGHLDKEECLAKNLAWFEGRYQELASTLSRPRIDEFARNLHPTRVSLKHWRSLGAFEDEVPHIPGHKQGRKHSKTNKGSKSDGKKGSKTRPKRRVYENNRGRLKSKGSSRTVQTNLTGR